MWETKMEDEIMAKTPKARDANIARMILYKTTILPPSTTPRSNAIFPIQPVLGKPTKRKISSDRFFYIFTVGFSRN